MNKKFQKTLIILLTLVLAFPLTYLSGSNLSVFASGKNNINSTHGELSYSIKKSTKAKKKVVKKKKKSTKILTPKPTLAPTATPTPAPTPTPVPTDSIATAYSNYFALGVATPARLLNDATTRSVVVKQFRTITMENETKPDALLDYNTCSSNPSLYNTNPAVRLGSFENYLKIAKQYGLTLRFHTLVWHSQTPRWFFAENYSKDANAPLVKREIMLQRMENYIKQIMECAKKYPDVIYAWDVVNEAIEPADGLSNGLRTKSSLWYQVVGDDFVEKAFTFARKYSYDKAGLFYNDYSEYSANKLYYIYNMLKSLKDKGLIDGMGMQSHINMENPTIDQYEAAVLKYASLGLEINVTELDMHNNKNDSATLQLQADRYKALFQMLLKLKKSSSANITHVTFWGLRDSDSWLTWFNKETSYPLLFDASCNKKPAYDALMSLVQ